MAVSPNSRDKDDQPPLAHDAVGPRSERAINYFPQTPPILFKLRDLTSPDGLATEASDPAKPADRKPAVDSLVSGSMRARQIERPAMAPTDSRELGSPAHHAGNLASDQDLGGGLAKGEPTPQESSRAETPARRGWGESVLAHKKTLALMGLVMVAALWSLGKRPHDEGDRETDLWSSLPGVASSGSEKIEFNQDDLIETESLDSIAATALAGVADGSQTQTTHRSLAEIEALFVPANRPSPAPVQATVQTSVAAHQPTVAVSVPPTASSAVNPSLPFDQSAFAAVVSSRSPIAPEIHSPSLQDLELAARAGQQTSFDTNQIELHYSRTPDGVANWLDYLPTHEHYASP